MIFLPKKVEEVEAFLYERSKNPPGMEKQFVHYSYGNYVRWYVPSRVEYYIIDFCISHMNAIFQALAYVPSVREYSEKYYLEHSYGQLMSPESATKKVVDLFRGMYTGKYKTMLMGDIVNKFKRSDPLTFLVHLFQVLENGFSKKFSIIKVSLHGKQTMR